ncbi:hypothetical protein [Mycoplasmopsis cynos]|uniref:Uncharacterized protein n=1 Tax=Mycoplasmopsis cynos TaxID=171284 RepID=A0ABD8AJ95_9BACT|nr:hypothetical protein [Mycoplasmopsis cynos]MCU9932516.1 hypothetical protein [Mycoplasmopsis cynos]MCU9935046.1 hypothetical protein [Mycoplasmopsis cynos]UWV80745.1 hypothetical protein NW069_00875 [Mycoplasmopsis cynos]UWV86113.1 hypothetical protein NW063_04830 [Mycoplasmopsis cynos]WQQ20087.1 hypothetical protein RRG46_00835 [Mycoplasmopsis cynos]
MKLKKLWIPMALGVSPIIGISTIAMNTTTKTSDDLNTTLKKSNSYYLTAYENLLKKHKESIIKRLDEILLEQAGKENFEKTKTLMGYRLYLDTLFKVMDQYVAKFKNNEDFALKNATLLTSYFDTINNLLNEFQRLLVNKNLFKVQGGLNDRIYNLSDFLKSSGDFEKQYKNLKYEDEATYKDPIVNKELKYPALDYLNLVGINAINKFIKAYIDHSTEIIQKYDQAEQDKGNKPKNDTKLADELNVLKQSLEKNKQELDKVKSEHQKSLKELKEVEVQNSFNEKLRLTFLILFLGTLALFIITTSILINKNKKRNKN